MCWTRYKKDAPDVFLQYKNHVCIFIIYLIKCILQKIYLEYDDHHRACVRLINFYLKKSNNSKRILYDYKYKCMYLT